MGIGILPLGIYSSATTTTTISTDCLQFIFTKLYKSDCGQALNFSENVYFYFLNEKESKKKIEQENPEWYGIVYLVDKSSMNQGAVNCQLVRP